MRVFYLRGFKQMAIFSTNKLLFVLSSIVALTPHIAGSAIESQAEIGRGIVALLDAQRAGTLLEIVTSVELVA